MNYRFLIIPAKWLAGVVIYLVLSAILSRLFVIGMLKWAHEYTVYRGLVLEIRFLLVPVFAMCLFWGALYASALAKPAAFGHTMRILKHLGWSCSLGLLGCVLLIRTYMLPLPDFQSTFALSAFIFLALSLSILCFVLGLLVWIHLAFGQVDPLAKKGGECADIPG